MQVGWLWRMGTVYERPAVHAVRFRMFLYRQCSANVVVLKHPFAP